MIVLGYIYIAKATAIRERGHMLLRRCLGYSCLHGFELIKW